MPDMLNAPIWARCQKCDQHFRTTDLQIEKDNFNKYDSLKIPIGTIFVKAIPKILCPKCHALRYS